MMELPGWKRTAAYATLFAAAFVVALRQTFPAEAVQERLVLEAAAQGWQVRLASAGPAGLFGVRLAGLVLESRDGARVPVDELVATLRVWPLLLGRRGVNFDARLWEGRITGLSEEGRSRRRLALAIRGVDLGRAVALRRAVGLDLGGTLEGDLDVTLDAREPARSSGHVDLRVARAVLLGGQLNLPSFGGALTLPRADLGEVVARATVRDGKAVFDRLDVKSPDVDFASEGLTVTLQPRLAYSAVFGKAHLKLADGFWQKSGSAALKSVAEMSLAQARGRDGAFHFQFYGNLSQLQTRPAP